MSESPPSALDVSNLAPGSSPAASARRSAPVPAGHAGALVGLPVPSHGAAGQLAAWGAAVEHLHAAGLPAAAPAFPAAWLRRRGIRADWVSAATSGDLLAQTLAYAARGWPVLPCRMDAGPCPSPPGVKCGCKVPIGQAVPDGCLDATTDPTVIRQWWRRWPAANVGIATGAPGPDVLDVDVKPAGSGYPALRRLMRAGLVAGGNMFVRTPSGGSHIYYAGSGQHCRSLSRHFLDFKAWHGYVLAPPSTIHGGLAYRVLDTRPQTASLDWQAVKRLLDPPRPTRKTTRAVWEGGDLPLAVQRALTSDAQDRSRALYRLVGACLQAGMDEDTIYQLAGTYQPALEKYGARLETEVGRCLHRIGA
jgi:Bifunctional DNA primase/polymerase, N-terminal